MSKHRIEEALRTMQEAAILDTIDTLREELAYMERHSIRIIRENARLKEQLRHLRASKKRPSDLVVELRRKITDKNKHLALQQQEITNLLAENATLKKRFSRKRKKP